MILLDIHFPSFGTPKETGGPRGLSPAGINEASSGRKEVPWGKRSDLIYDLSVAFQEFINSSCLLLHQRIIIIIIELEQDSKSTDLSTKC